MRVFDMRRFSLNDGPGIRVTIFLKGCPLSCDWCHNPEGISHSFHIMYNKERCIDCKMCKESSAECPAGALWVCGRDVTTSHIMEFIERDVDVFDNSGGGVTFSGGEPLQQHKELVEILELCRAREIHTAVDTSLYAPREVVERVASKTHLILADIKHLDSEMHKKRTGVDNALILSNIKFLISHNYPIRIRVPLIEGFNDSNQFKLQLDHFLSSCTPNGISIPQIDYLPYHNTGKGKLSLIKADYRYGV